MIWILIVTLFGGPSGPVTVDRATCEGVAAAVTAGRIVAAELPDGSPALVLAATCRSFLEV